MDGPNKERLELITSIVGAYLGSNKLPMSGIPDLINSVNATLSRLDRPVEPEAPVQQPAVNPKKSVFPDHIICLEDGKSFRSLKRHLMSHYGMTPEEYRTKWKLAPDYPMVAPEYSAARSALAKSLGLGRKPKAAPPPPAPAKRGRKPKVASTTA